MNISSQNGLLRMWERTAMMPARKRVWSVQIITWKHAIPTSTVRTNSYNYWKGNLESSTGQIAAITNTARSGPLLLSEYKMITMGSEKEKYAIIHHLLSPNITTVMQLLHKFHTLPNPPGKRSKDSARVRSNHNSLLVVSSYK